jgi:malate dehydrogenase (oxaloacetate-decarboxylating)
VGIDQEVVDYTYRVRVRHEPGQLAKVLGAIADAGGLIGEARTCALTRTFSIRELTVEVRDDEQAEELRGAMDDLDGVEVCEAHDRALALHEGGKLRIQPVRRVETVQDMRDVYTPGVARVCQAIRDDPDAARRYTTTGRSVAICTNGTRVLGLGDVGPLAAMPVMEGKAVFYSQLAGISAMPILIDADDPDEFVETVVRIAPTFGGIHLEDISAPECFEIESRLIDALDKPVMHDDVHGTAVVALAAARVACRHGGVDFEDQVVGQLGLGAAGFGIASLMVEAGVEGVLAFDPDESSHEHARERGIEMASMDEVMERARVVIATTGQPGSIDAGQVRDGQIVLALSNPDPEIDPDAAMDAGAAFAADGSMVNNVLGYPGMFRGALDAGAEEMSVEMKLAAAQAIADAAPESELVPDALDESVHRAVADAVREAAASSKTPTAA